MARPQAGKYSISQGVSRLMTKGNEKSQSEKLSKLQRTIIANLHTGKIERKHGQSASDRAVYSRTLRRLEARGLVVIVRDSHGRTQAVKLSPSGQDIALEWAQEAGRLQEIAAKLERERAARQAQEIEQASNLSTPTERTKLAELLRAAFPGIPIEWRAVLGLRVRSKQHLRRTKRSRSVIFGTLISNTR